MMLHNAEEALAAAAGGPIPGNSTWVRVGPPRVQKKPQNQVREPSRTAAPIQPIMGTQGIGVVRAGDALQDGEVFTGTFVGARETGLGECRITLRSEGTVVRVRVPGQDPVAAQLLHGSVAPGRIVEGARLDWATPGFRLWTRAPGSYSAYTPNVGIDAK